MGQMSSRESPNWRTLPRTSAQQSCVRYQVLGLCLSAAAASRAVAATGRQDDIPDSLDYETIGHLRAEARQKLARIRPVSLAQASRISGITPADIALLMAHLEG